MISFVPGTRTPSSVGVECYQYKAVVVFPDNLAIKTSGCNDLIFLYLFSCFCYNVRNCKIKIKFPPHPNPLPPRGREIHLYK
jgi:hypothetical protein